MTLGSGLSLVSKVFFLASKSLDLFLSPSGEAGVSLSGDAGVSSTGCEQKNGPPPWKVYPFWTVFPCKFYKFWHKRPKISCFL